MIPLGLTAAASATDATIQKKNYESSTTTLTVSNEEMEDIMKKVKSLEETGLLIKGISETIKSEAKEQKVRFLSMLLGTLAASILGNALSGRGVIRERRRNNKSRSKLLMPSHPLTNFEIQKYYQNEPKFNGVYSTND